MRDRPVSQQVLQADALHSKHAWSESTVEKLGSSTTLQNPSFTANTERCQAWKQSSGPKLGAGCSYSRQDKVRAAGQYSLWGFT